MGWGGGYTFVRSVIKAIREIDATSRDGFFHIESLIINLLSHVMNANQITPTPPPPSPSPPRTHHHYQHPKYRRPHSAHENETIQSACRLVPAAYTQISNF